MCSNEFKNFIQNLLRKGNLNEKHILKFTNKENIRLFVNAFTHKTFDAEENYELPEFLGDTTVNWAIARYIREWDSKIVSVKYLTRLKHNISSKKQLALIAHNAGFMCHIRIGEELQEKFIDMENNIKLKNKDYLSVLEDTFEAFIGTVEHIIEKHLGVVGSGMGICYNIIKSFLDQIHISLRYEDIFDAKTRFKELCDKRGWDFKSTMSTSESYEDGRKIYTVKVIGYPFGNKKKEEENKGELAEITLPIKIEAQNKAAEKALTKLKKYDIWDPPPNPYQTKN